MTTFTNKFDTHKEAFEENLVAIKTLLDYDKTKAPDKWKSAQGCLGYSAFILLCSQINSVGNLFEGHIFGDRRISNDKSSFQILNSEYFGLQNLSIHTLDEFYSCFRNKLTHNLSLPTNFILTIKSDNGRWYDLSKDNRGLDIISTVYLMDLYDLCCLAHNNLQKVHSIAFDESKKMQIIYHKDLGKNDIPPTPYASGNTF